MSYKDKEKEVVAKAFYRKAHQGKMDLQNSAWRKAHPERVIAYGATYRRKNRGKIAAAKAAWRKAHPGEEAASKAAWRKANRERHLATGAAWGKANSKRRAALHAIWVRAFPEKMAAVTARRRAKKLKATPSWLSEDHFKTIGNFYKTAKILTEITGVGFEVDHVVPLQGKTVSGLHVPWNLQVVTREANQGKGCKWSPADKTGRQS